MKLLRLLALVGVASAVGLAAPAPPLQHEHQHPPGAAEKIGKVEFSVSCNAEAQKEFNRAVALLHSFWYDEAVKAFTAVTGKDPACAMAYWGVAMSHYYPLWYPPNEAHLRAGAEAVQKAKAAGAKTDRERDLIAGVEAFYKNWQKRDHPKRVLAYEQAMERLYSRYPEDREVAAFYALALQGSATALPPDKTYARQKKSGAIVERLFAEQPDHPGAAHYTIHAYDYPELCERGLAAARKYAQIAPASPHALHMPSHIFTRLGYWEESIVSNRDSAGAAQAYAARLFPGATYWEDLHAKDYLLYAYLQRAEDRKAKEVFEETLRVQKVETENFAAAYALAAIPARYVLERRRWEQARAVELQPQNFPWSRFPWAEGTVYLARGLGAARSGDLATGRENADKLKKLDETLSAKPDYWSTQVRIAHWTVAAWLAHAEAKNDEAVRLMRQAADLDDATGKHPVTPGPILPARELLGDLLLDLRQPTEALLEFEAALRDSPNRLNALYGAARAAELAGNGEKARSYYTQLVALGERGDGERTELQAAKAFLAKK